MTKERENIIYYIIPLHTINPNQHTLNLKQMYFQEVIYVAHHNAFFT